MNKSEKQRIAKQTERILNALRGASKNGLTNADLSKIALRYGANLGDLYKNGFKIDKLSLGNGLYNYTLVSEPDTVVVREKALNKLLSEIEKLGTVDKKSFLNLLNNNSIAVKYKANTYK